MIIRFGFLIILCAAIARCRLPEIKQEYPAVNTMKKGDKFRINLPEDHTSGYLWQINRNFNNGVVKQLNEVWHGNTKGIDFNLQANDTGQVTIAFILRKYTDTVSYKRFTIKIIE